MMVAEQVNDKLRKLSVAAQEEVLDFVEFLLEKSARRDSSGTIGAAQKKAKDWEEWANSHDPNTPVIADDSREAIYEDD